MMEAYQTGGRGTSVVILRHVAIRLLSVSFLKARIIGLQHDIGLRHINNKNLIIF